MGDICHENPHTSESLIRVLLSKYSPSARLDLVSVVSVMKDRKSPVTFGQGGPITQEIQTTVYHALAEAGTKVFVLSRLLTVKGTWAKH